MQKKLGLIALLTVFTASASPMAAVSILPVQDDRFTEVPPSLGGRLVPNPPFSDFDGFTGGVGVTAAFQDSRIRVDHMAGTGSVQNDGAGGDPAQSVFDITFQVDAPAAFTLDGTLEADIGTAAVTLSGPSGILFQQSVLPTGGPSAFDVFATAGFLQAGVDYRLVVESNQPMNTQFTVNAYSFQFSVLALPEPAVTALLLVAGGRYLRRSTPAPRGAASARFP